MSAIATYDTEWADLSEEHKLTREEIGQTLEAFSHDDSLQHYAHTVVGVFGSGKTQLLYYIYDQCLQRDVLPLYFEADRLFKPVFEIGDPGPGEITDIINERVSEIEDALAQNDEEAVHDLLNPGNDADKESLVESVLDAFGGEEVDKKAILVDELEQQYESLQEHVRADENSPLRDWLERGNELKFLALAPAGMYEMGGADRTRCGRIVIPPVDINHLREEYFGNDAGLANACWWLSRGNPRHILSNAKKLNRRENIRDSPPHQIAEFINNLDPIGQDPSVVPAANLNEIHRGRLEELLTLTPQQAEEQRRYVIDVDEADRAEFIERVAETFEVHRTVADYLARYFFLVANTLSNEDNVCYLDELNGLFALAIDFLLEYQHNNPDIEDDIREVTEAYNQIDSNEIDATIGRLFEYKQTTKNLPLSTDEIQEVFRLPIVDPVVKNYTVQEVKETHEGDGRPLWKIEQQNRTVYFFISHRDFEAYSETDEFLDAALPDGNTVLCIVAESVDDVDGELKQWLQNNGKLAIETTSPLLTDFLISLAGEISETPPADLEVTLDELAESDDPILERKVNIYRESLERLIIGTILSPTTFCQQDVPHTHVWGRDQIGNRKAVIPAVAQAYREELTDQDIQLLGDLGARFESGGELNFLVTGKAGYVTVAKDLLPLHSREHEHQQVIKHLRRYFDSEAELRTLSQLVSEETFRKISTNENKDRLLTAFWRATRGEFEVSNLGNNNNWVRRELIDRLKSADDLASAVSSERHDATIDFDSSQSDDSYEAYMAAQYAGAFDQLHELTADCIDDGDILTQKLYSMYLTALREYEQTIRQFGALVDSAKDEVDDFETTAENLEENLWEYTQTREFVDISESEINSVIQAKSLTGQIAIDELAEEAESARRGIRKYSRDMGSIDESLEEIEDIFEETAAINPKDEEEQT